MSTITLSSKHQITLPADMVRSLKLKPGDKIVAELIDDHIVLLPQPESWVDYFMGSMKGVYGSTKEEIDRYIAEVRYGRDVDALKDALALDQELRALYESTSPTEALSLSQLAESSGVYRGYADQKLSKLEELGAVKRLEHPTYKAQPYYRRSA
ncbi:MAG: AbrB/MazE/SpoVT family DNA-binding domain-containing protein [Chloroflexi bacterium]|nr:AbrB/MazE/SpoVT family DNA-binding domain-containing protein [Chloroflexota bacterium]